MQVLAHADDDSGSAGSLLTGGMEVVVPLALGAALYAVGTIRLWRRAGVGHGLPVGQVTAFMAGMLALAAAMVWPLDALGTWSLSAHIGQHMVMMAIAAPLLVLGNPGAAFAHALPSTWVRRVAGGLRIIAPGLRHISAATLVHSVVLWSWHLPRLTTAALENDALHWLMHGTFLVSGAWFWSAIGARHREVTAAAGAALLALVALMMQMGLIGALLCFAPRPLYAIYVERAPVLGLDALADQQLAGMLMWVPTCLPYLIAAVTLVVARLGAHAPIPTAQGDGFQR